MSNKSTDIIKFRHGQEVGNRIVMAPMCTYSGTKASSDSKGGHIREETLDYYKARSQAAGMIITEYHYVSENGGPATPVGFHEQLSIKSDDYFKDITRLRKAITQDGNKAILQIAHSGREAAVRASRNQPVYGPSALDFDFLAYEVEAFDAEQIEEIIKDFGRATKRAIDAGFNGVEIHGANHYLLQQFFSAFSNRRDDKWGGSLEKRMNFPLAVVEEVKNTVKKYGPKDFIIGYRISPEEIHGENVGYTYNEAKQLIAEVVKYELDYIHLSLWDGYDSKPENSEKTYAEEFREVLDEETKLIIVNGVFNAEDAENAIDYADLVAVGRGTIIDPEFGKKIAEGNGQEIISEITPDQYEKAAWTSGLTELFTDGDNAVGLPPLPGWESIADKHTGIDYNKAHQNLIKDEKK